MRDSRVVLLGATGRTGGRVLAQLLERGVPVRAVVRSAARLPQSTAGSPGLEVVEADLTQLSDDALRELVRDCDAVVSCLGHNITPGGIFGAPRDLVARTVERMSVAARSLRPAEPVRLVLMSSVSVNAADGRDARRGALEKAALWVLRGAVPPARDNQRAADFLRDRVGADDPFVEWVAVRPDTLVEGDVGEYVLHEGLVSSLAKPDETAMANVAHFMCELVTDDATWRDWKCGLPVIVNAA